MRTQAWKEEADMRMQTCQEAVAGIQKKRTSEENVKKAKRSIDEESENARKEWPQCMRTQTM